MGFWTAFSWRKFLQIWAQWLGIGLASVFGGILLGLLLKSGLSQPMSLSIAVVCALTLSFWLWKIIGRQFLVRQKQSYFGVSPYVVQIGGPQPAIAAVVICYIFLHPVHHVQQPFNVLLSTTSTTFSDQPLTS
jgi:hypothetical protein